MTETEGRRWLLKASHEGAWLYQPIESTATGIGIPDGYFRTRVAEGWIELKVINFHGQEHVVIPFRRGQYNWLKRYADLGGRAFLFVFYVAHLRQDTVCVMIFYNDYIQREYDVQEMALKALVDLPLSKITHEQLIQSLSHSLIL